MRTFMSYGLGLVALAWSTTAIAQEEGVRVEEASADVTDPWQACGQTIYDLESEKAACVRVIVSLEGRSTNCMIAISAGDPIIDQQVCAAAEEHAIWNPALNDLGEPIEQEAFLWLKVGPDGEFVAGRPWPEINYGYPSRALRRGEEGRVGFRVEVDAEGFVRNCVILFSSGSADLDHATCDQTTRQARFPLTFDDNGEPVETTYARVLNWQL